MKIQKQNLSFGAIAKLYQKYRRSYDPKLYDLLFSLLSQEKLQILDVGCGTGKSSEPLFLKAGKKNISVIGVDPDGMMLREARLSAKKNHLPIEYFQGFAEKLPFERGRFDAVISGAAFHWFGNTQAISSIRNVLKDRGVLFIFWAQYVNSNKQAIGSDIYDKYDWIGIPKNFRSQKSVSRLLSKEGFKNVKEASIPFVEKKTIAETIGCLKTNSSYALMSAKAKRRFTGEMTRAYKIALGKNKYDINKLELRICYGFK